MKKINIEFDEKKLTISEDAIVLVEEYSQVPSFKGTEKFNRLRDIARIEWLTHINSVVNKLISKINQNREQEEERMCHYFWVKLGEDEWRIAEFEEQSGDFYLAGDVEIFFGDEFEEIGDEV